MKRRKFQSYKIEKNNYPDGTIQQWELKKEKEKWRIVSRFENVPYGGNRVKLEIEIGEARKEKMPSGEEYWHCQFIDPYDQNHSFIATRHKNILRELVYKMDLLAQKDMARQDFSEDIDLNNVDEILTSWG